ncbi:beta- -n-acetylglucosaminyltransferase [Fusarium langsethiae]|uniref:UDP-N-acetylglucosamine transferase subunit ALG14 n=1 Tax=Fusarium langsethiae TaxID=179993 RepID=A0A0N0DCI0_FUSLA|nr:beta- -n-acetylglucosaminyltransferase [Fusarium langsethiae]
MELAHILAALTGIGLALFAITSSKLATGLLVCLFACNLFLVLSTARHVQLVGARRRFRRSEQASRDQRINPYEYYLFVLGSGGHTKEMLMMMDDGYCSFQNFHRRYLISSGDAMSTNHVVDYETELEALCATQALMNPPANTIGARMRYPTCIFTNGPATGFFVGLAAHLLKLLYVVPETSMHIVYIESWARITTLSLTGKLFYYTGIADVLVQHKEVAEKYKVQYCGEIVFNARREI